MNRAVKCFRGALPALALLTGACDDGFGPAQWVAVEDTIVLYSASRAEYVGLRSALDVAMQPVMGVPLESPGVTGNWDVALTDDGAGLALTPAGAFKGLDSRARVALITGTAFDDLKRAPSDTTMYSAQSVRLQQNAVYVIRSRRANCGLTSGYRYAKIRPITIDPQAGTFRFSVLRNPYCEDRSFVPPEK